MFTAGPPLFLFALLDRLVQNAEISFALAGLLVAFYIRRGAGLASSGAAVFGTVVTYTVVLIVLLSFGTIFGWVDPNPSVAYSHAWTAGRALFDALTGPVMDVAERAAGRFR